MVIHKVKSEEDKGYQQSIMVVDCINHWCRLNNVEDLVYPDIMNMKTYRVNLKHGCYVALTYHLNLNKW